MRHACISVVPNIFGTRDWFCGRQFFHGWGQEGDASGGSASDGEGALGMGMADEALLCPAAHLLL